MTNSWPDCDQDGCSGARTGDQTSCLAHMKANKRDLILKLFSQGGGLDVRGVTISEVLAGKILDAAPRDSDGHRTFSAVRFEGATFEGDARFEEATFKGDARFEGATFKGDAQFEEVTFNGNARFDKATFHGTAGFTRTTYGPSPPEVRGFGEISQAGFDQAVFEGNARFDGARFEVDARFERATFKDDAGFEGVTFKANARFGRATFRANAHFYEAKFSDSAVFRKTTFNGTAGFKRTTYGPPPPDVWGFGEISQAEFGEAVFESDAEFGEATFKYGASFYKATFNHSASFYKATFNDRAGFGEVTFNDSAGFGKATFKDSAIFSKATFKGVTRFNNGTFESDVQFDVAVFKSNAEFLGVKFKGDVPVLGPVRVERRLDLDEAQFASAVRIMADANELRCRRGKFPGGVRFDVYRALVRLEDLDLSAPSLLIGPAAAASSPVGSIKQSRSLSGATAGQDRRRHAQRRTPTTRRAGPLPPVNYCASAHVRARPSQYGHCRSS